MIISQSEGYRKLMISLDKFNTCDICERNVNAKKVYNYKRSECIRSGYETRRSHSHLVCNRCEASSMICNQCCYNCKVKKKNFCIYLMKGAILMIATSEGNMIITCAKNAMISELS